LKKIIDNIPFLRITAALSAGILFGSLLQTINYVLYAVLVLLTILLLWFNAYYKFKLAVFFGLGTFLIFFVTGILVFNLFNIKPQLYRNGKFIATVQEILQEKTNSYQSVLEIHLFLRHDSLFTTNEKVLVYLAKDEKAKALQPGQTILFNSSPQLIVNSNNPFEFNYKKYMERRKIYRLVYLPSDAWMLTTHDAPFRISVFAEQLRMHLLSTYIKQNWDEQQLNVLSALTLGYKRGLDPEIKRTFASAGALHILAVSGLHVGILYLIITFLFGFLKKQQTGRLFFVLAVIISLWAFAFLTGLSPSVKRAAAMFTFVVVGQNLRRQINIYNTLTASAFFLLLLNPNNLFEAGFQLSYSAVFGIVYLQPRFEKLLFFRLIIVRYFWSLLTVTVAAQIATFPFAVFYFNQFPVYFWLSNLLIIPAVTLLIPLGIILLAFNWVPFFSVIVSGIIAYMLNFLINFLSKIEHLPQSVITLNFSGYELALVLVSLVSILFFIEFRHQKYFKSGLLFFLLFLLFSLGRHTVDLYRTEIIAYNYSQQNVLHLISGKRNYVISEKAFNESDLAHRLVENTVVGLQLNRPLYLTFSESYNDSVLYLNKGAIIFDRQVVCLQNERQTMSSPFIPDLIVGNGEVLKAGRENYSLQSRFIGSVKKAFRISDNKATK